MWIWWWMSGTVQYRFHIPQGSICLSNTHVLPFASLICLSSRDVRKYLRYMHLSTFIVAPFFALIMSSLLLISWIPYAVILASLYALIFGLLCMYKFFTFIFNFPSIIPLPSFSQYFSSPLFTFSSLDIVPDPGSWSRAVVFVGAGCWGNLRRDAGNLEWGGDGEGLRKGRLVHE